MQLTRDIDLYCERLAPGLWGEPVNAASNLAFFVAAWAAARALARLGPSPTADARRDLSLLPVLMAAIGAGSLCFHLVGQVWAAGLDSGFIALYLMSYTAVWAHRVAGLPWPRAAAGAPAFAVACGLTAVGLAGLGLSWMPPGLAMYAGAWGVIVGLLAYTATRTALRGSGSAPWLAATLGAYTVSLTARQLDLPLCPRWPLGTHFAWHLLNGLALYCSARAVMAATRRAPSAARRQSTHAAL